jgi:hypothetical protein
MQKLEILSLGGSGQTVSFWLRQKWKEMEMQRKWMKKTSEGAD